MVDILNATWLHAIRGYGDFGMLLLIWLVQLIIYPSFRWTDPVHFKHWHYVYTGLISLFVAPLILCQVSIYGWLLLSGCVASEWSASGWPAGIRWDVAINTLLLAFNLFGTVMWSVPCHDRLQKLGYDRPTIDRLVFTNWFRTFGWTAMWLIDLAADHSLGP